MTKLLSRLFFLTPRDVGIEGYSLEEIVERMKPVEPDPDDELLYFARAVSDLREDTSTSGLSVKLDTDSIQHEAFKA